MRCWFAPHDMHGGREIHEQIDQAIRVHDKVLLILSEDSMKSNWVKTELGKTVKREKEEGKRVLFPVGLVSYDTLQRWSTAQVWTWRRRYEGISFRTSAGGRNMIRIRRRWGGWWRTSRRGQRVTAEERAPLLIGDYSTLTDPHRVAQLKIDESLKAPLKRTFGEVRKDRRGLRIRRALGLIARSIKNQAPPRAHSSIWRTANTGVVSATGKKQVRLHEGGEILLHDIRNELRNDIQSLLAHAFIRDYLQRLGNELHGAHWNVVPVFSAIEQLDQSAP